MDLDAFLADIKRSSQYGSVTTVTDKMTDDILNSIIMGLDLICDYWPWDWLYEPVTVSLSAGVTDYTLASNIDSLVILAPDSGRPLDRATLRKYFEWKRQADGGTEGAPSYYTPIGRVSGTNALKIRIGDIPSGTTVLSGFGKKVMTRFTTASLGSAAAFAPFPIKYLYVLKEFVLGDVRGYQGKLAESLATKKNAETLLARMSGRGSTDPAAQITSDIPAYLRRKFRARRGGSVA